MILIASIRADKSTRDVIDWLDFYGVTHHFFDLYKTGFENVSFQIGDTKEAEQNIDPKTVTGFWYRRHQKVLFEDNPNSDQTYVYDKNTLSRHLETETDIIFEHLYCKFAKGNVLSDVNKRTINKLITLDLAQALGIKIPNTLITRSKKELISFREKHDSIITKAISETYSFNSKENGQSFFAYTEILSDQTITQLPERFFPSLFQEQIKKDIEIRSFYLDGQFYSMAIFSQLDKQTSSDFRLYNYKKPNRNVPFKLPEELELKLCQLMKSLELNTGSIDLIKSLEGDFYLLEVNPVGQFGMTSAPCNYHLEEKVAKFLMQ